jgi:hypothetical protein
MYIVVGNVHVSKDDTCIQTGKDTINGGFLVTATQRPACQRMHPYPTLGWYVSSACARSKGNGARPMPYSVPSAPAGWNRVVHFKAYKKKKEKPSRLQAWINSSRVRLGGLQCRG